MVQKLKPRVTEHVLDSEALVGTTYAPVTVRASARSRKEYQAEFPADSGAIECMAPGDELRKAGIRPRGRETYELADGSLVDLDYGFAEIELMGKVTTGRILFGPDNCEPLLGVTVMESLGVVVDPRNQRLKFLPAIRLK